MICLGRLLRPCNQCWYLQVKNETLRREKKKRNLRDKIVFIVRVKKEKHLSTKIKLLPSPHGLVITLCNYIWLPPNLELETAPRLTVQKGAACFQRKRRVCRTKVKQKRNPACSPIGCTTVVSCIVEVTWNLGTMRPGNLTCILERLRTWKKPRIEKNIDVITSWFIYEVHSDTDESDKKCKCDSSHATPYLRNLQILVFVEVCG